MYLSYTYFIRNRITNQFYYGSRYRNVKLKRKPSDDIWVHYFTSSKKIKSLINQYGKDSFNVEIISELEDYDTCYRYEQILIEQNINNPLCLNKHYTRAGKVKFLRAGAIVSKETRNKMSIAKKNIPHTAEHNQSVSMSLIKKYNTPIPDTEPKRIRRLATSETKIKMSLSNLNRTKKNCPHCSKIADPGNYARYHGTNCKHK